MRAWGVVCQDASKSCLFACVWPPKTRLTPFPIEDSHFQMLGRLDMLADAAWKGASASVIQVHPSLRAALSASILIFFSRLGRDPSSK